MRIPLHQLRLKPNIPAGMNPFVLMSLAYRYRSSDWDAEPALVTPFGDHWQVEDGRHRFVGSYIAGRYDLLCTPEEPD